ncbi:MAG: ATP synthase F1 subunit delta [Cytophagaceae bacterium]|nr:ATP synthase F1 subunit delta [Cytophagaceae bacterium]
MHESRVASRYANSLLELAHEKGALEQVHKDMVLFTKIGEENPALVRIFKNPIITHEKKLAILNSLLKGRVSDLTFSMFDIISRKNREPYLYFIAKEFISLYKKKNNIETAEVTTTFPLTDAQRTSFVNLVAGATGKKVDLHEKIQDEIIGGYILKIGDRQIDESVKSKLQKLRTKFKDNPYISKY